jgi:hypothetical protein
MVTAVERIDGGRTLFRKRLNKGWLRTIPAKCRRLQRLRNGRAAMRLTPGSTDKLDGP